MKLMRTKIIVNIIFVLFTLVITVLDSVSIVHTSAFLFSLSYILFIICFIISFRTFRNLDKGQETVLLDNL